MKDKEFKELKCKNLNITRRKLKLRKKAYNFIVEKLKFDGKLLYTDETHQNFNYNSKL